MGQLIQALPGRIMPPLLDDVKLNINTEQIGKCASAGFSRSPDIAY